MTDVMSQYCLMSIHFLYIQRHCRRYHNERHVSAAGKSVLETPLEPPEDEKEASGASGDEIPEELNEEEVIDIGALAEVQDKVFEAWAGWRWLNYPLVNVYIAMEKHHF